MFKEIGFKMNLVKWIDFKYKLILEVKKGYNVGCVIYYKSIPKSQGQV